MFLVSHCLAVHAAMSYVIVTEWTVVTEWPFVLHYKWTVYYIPGAHFELPIQWVIYSWLLTLLARLIHVCISKVLIAVYYKKDRLQTGTGFMMTSWRPHLSTRSRDGSINIGPTYTFNLFKPTGVKWLHFKVFRAILIFWHLGTLALTTERQNARMSKKWKKVD